VTESIKQNVPTTSGCPECGGQLLLMTRKADGKRFLACRNFYAPEIRCPYTRDEVPVSIRLREIGAPTLPALD
jgi:DNA-directed RNA polymerase subunit RPC12/RpoP